jgi:hypothetical protein
MTRRPFKDTPASNDLRTKFGERVRYFRLKVGLSQEQLDDSCGFWSLLLSAPEGAEHVGSTKYSHGFSDVGSGHGRRMPRRANDGRRLHGHPSTRKDERQMTSDIFVEGTSYRAHIKVIGRSDYFALSIDDGCVDGAA